MAVTHVQRYKRSSLSAHNCRLSVSRVEVTEPSLRSHNILISSQTGHSSVPLPALNLLELVVVDAHERNLSAAPLVELVATGLTAETLEQQLSAEVTEGQCKEGLPHLWIKQRHTDQSHPGCTEHFSQPLRDTCFLKVLTKLCVVSGTFSNTSTCSSSPVSHEMSVSQPIGFFSLKQEVGSIGNCLHLSQPLV